MIVNWNNEGLHTPIHWPCLELRTDDQPTWRWEINRQNNLVVKWYNSPNSHLITTIFYLVGVYQFELSNIFTSI